MGSIFSKSREPGTVHPECVLADARGKQRRPTGRSCRGGTMHPCLDSGTDVRRTGTVDPTQESLGERNHVKRTSECHCSPRDVGVFYIAQKSVIRDTAARVHRPTLVDNSSRQIG